MNFRLSAIDQPATMPSSDIYFYVPDLDSLADLPDSPKGYWSWLTSHDFVATGKYNWIIQTALYLKASGLRCEVTSVLPTKGIVISHFDNLRSIKVASDLQYFVCIKPDRFRALPHCHVHIVQNPNDIIASLPHRIVFKTRYVTYWPQPSLLPRLQHRGTTVQNIRFYGRLEELEPSLHPVLGAAASDEAPVDVVPMKSWHDYRDTDVVLAVRGFDPASQHRTKPASKVVNAWRAGVPAIVSPDSAFMELRRSELDFLVVRGRDDLINAIARLRENPELYRKMVENGKERARDFSPEVITRRWVDLITHVLIPDYGRWSRFSPLRRRISNKLRARFSGLVNRRVATIR